LEHKGRERRIMMYVVAAVAIVAAVAAALGVQNLLA
jgi:hypothetical protein